MVVRASASDELEAWQVQKLQQALLAGRRQVKVRVGGAVGAALQPSPAAYDLGTSPAQVEKLCKDLGLDRQTVLQWLKTAPPPDL